MTMRPAHRLCFLILALTVACAACALQTTTPVKPAPDDGKPQGAIGERPIGPAYGAPRLAVGQEGQVYLLWLAMGLQEGQSSSDVLIARSADGGATWSQPPTSLKPAKATIGGGHQIATGPKGQVYVVWRDWPSKTKRARLHFVRSQDYGTQWDASPQVVSVSDDAGFPQLLTDQEGGVHVASLVGPKSHRVLDVMSSYDFGGTFPSTPTRLTAAFPASEHGITNYRVAADEEGRLYVVWEEEVRRGTDSRIYLRRSLDRGKTWASPVLVSTPEEGEHRALTPQVVTTQNGQVYVAWAQDEFRADHEGKPYEVKFPDRFISINRSLDYGQTWLPRPIRLNPVDQGPLVSATPQLSLDRRGHIYATWIEGDRSFPKRLLFARSSDAGIVWTDPKVRLERVRLDLTSPFGGQPAHPMIRSDDSGHIWIVWQEISPDQKQWQLLVNRSDDGGVTWRARATPLVSVTSRGGGYRGVSFEDDAHGRLYVAWEGGREDAQAIYLNRSIDFGETWLSREVEIGRR